MDWPRIRRVLRLTGDEGTGLCQCPRAGRDRSLRELGEGAVDLFEYAQQGLRRFGRMRACGARTWCVAARAGSLSAMRPSSFSRPALTFFAAVVRSTVTDDFLYDRIGEERTHEVGAQAMAAEVPRRQRRHREHSGRGSRSYGPYDPYAF